LTINGNKQLITGNSPVENLINTTDLKSVDLNLTSLYKNDLTGCKRTGTIISNRYVEIKDVIEAGSKQLTIRWNLATQAVPQRVSKKIIRLTQSNKILYLLFDGTDAVIPKTWSTKPATSYEEPNSDVFFTGFEFTVPAGTTQTITVKLIPEGDPELTGIDLSAAGEVLNENFEAYTPGSLSSGFVSWKMNPATNGALKAVLGEVTTNPSKSGINKSDKVLKIVRQDDTDYVTSANAGNFTYRGAQAYGFDLRINTASVVELKYYKTSPGKIGVRIYDGRGNMLLVDFTDPYEGGSGYSLSQWRTAQFAVGSQDLSKFSFTGSGYLLISPERNGTEAYQEKALTMYVDDIKLLPFPTVGIEHVTSKPDFYAYYDSKSELIYVKNLPQKIKTIRLFDLTGRKLQEVRVTGDIAILDPGKYSGRLFIVQVLTSDGKGNSIKVIR